MNRILRYLWTSPNTLLGLVLFPFIRLTGGQAQLTRGVLELHGGLAAFLLRRCVPLPNGAAAMTLGHVILAQDQTCLHLARDHEHIHVRQYERWGPLFLPAYFTASLLALLRNQHPYRDNPFERQAFDVPNRVTP